MNNHFIKLSKEKFHFLEMKYGAQIEIITDNELRWNIDNYCLRVIYDNRRSYELDILLNRDGDDSLTFDLHELARYAGVSSEKNAFQASTDERLAVIINRMANLLSLICNQVSLFSLETITNLQQQRIKECFAYAKHNELEKMRVEAENAWNEKNYAVIKSLYEPFLDNLTKTEIKKYNYALKHLQ